MKVSTDPKKINELLERGTDTVYPTKKALKEKLESGERIRLYLGVDPTGEDLHIGHSVVLRKLKQFQELGHEVILLIGDFTGLIGDPTGKDKTRKQLTRKQVLDNAKHFQTQASKILDFTGKNPVEIKYNSQWLAKLTFKEVVELASHFTVQQMLERDMFQERLKNNKPIHLHEFLYPLMQGYDSVAMDVDLEVGGSDQMFNMMAGRELMKDYKKKDKFVLTVPLLVDSKNVKIGKTEGNVIAINAEPNDLFGKIMTLGDDVIISTFELCTDASEEEIKKIEKDLKAGKNPRDYKAKLAFEMVLQYNENNLEAAKNAEAEFSKVFKDKGKPKNIPELPVEKSEYPPMDLLVDLELLKSKSEAKRVIEQGGFKLNDKKISDWKQPLKLQDGDMLQVGKRKFVRIKL
ncbi:tyrosine--tRNA ligase [Patescibacteria group bacterium]|nr:tyrosine--tRNA ligase [Patescibacteria group bacterium]MBU1673689.1 tyrosine--tRNA ligase [Patescibacteria group bacterium]MBU1963499.1 tyrosine--tRNA ligase [Patescibacteria group bacterium]